MFGLMLAPQHPYSVVADDSGRCAITEIPAGTYKLKAWHPTLGVQESEVTVTANETIEANFNYQSN